MIIKDNSLEYIADQLASQDYAITEQFLTLEEVRAIREVFEYHREEDNFKRAGIGKQEDFTLDKQIRGDYIKWIDPGNTFPAVKVFLDKINALKDYLNMTCYLGLRDYETHFAIYPPGSFYKRHLDQFQGDGARRITFICYLNEGWQPGDGGELRMYFKDREEDLHPTAGKLVCFRSEMLEHEVLVANKHRYSLTGWMLNHPVGLGFIKQP
ncbi:2OG-Fe(II) oxygenase [Fulvivirga maritima]|uniref:2OG-Fe(II) oxygenase n=1 Tax=Fulvivirga maritima TaxID=2904247 RepID=UPI001F3E756B|nr:2OG-Fe(II) oxygenase [Fulvivirga maritima]UII28348.1 2OG-Fe(II) oxygenase [Fulvivirga maritima]